MIQRHPLAQHPHTGSAVARNEANSRYKTKPIASYGDRKCLCGAPLSKYNPGIACAVCVARARKDLGL